MSKGLTIQVGSWRLKDLASMLFPFRNPSKKIRAAGYAEEHEGHYPPDPSGKGWWIPNGYVTTGTAAQALGVTTPTIRNKINQGQLPAKKQYASTGTGKFRYVVPSAALDGHIGKESSSTQKESIPNCLSKPSSAKLKKKERGDQALLKEMLVLFEHLRDSDPLQVARVPTSEGAKDIHREFWPVLAWLSYFFEGLNATAKDDQLKLSREEDVDG